MSITIVTDSASDLGGAKSKALGVHIVPTRVVFDGTSFRDGVDMDRVTFYTRLFREKLLPTTEPAAVEDFVEMFAHLVEAGHEIVCPLTSSAISKTYENALHAALRFGSKVQVIDSQTVCGGLFLQVRMAADAAHAGASATEIVAMLASARSAQHATVVPPDLSFISRSTRLNRFKLALGTLLGVTPVLAMRDGNLVPIAKARGFEQAQEMMVEIAARAVTDPSRTHILVGHAHAAHLGDAALTKFKAKLSGEPASASLFEFGPSVAVHSGPKTLGVFSLTV